MFGAFDYANPKTWCFRILTFDPIAFQDLLPLRVIFPHLA